MMVETAGIDDTGDAALDTDDNAIAEAEDTELKEATETPEEVASGDDNAVLDICDESEDATKLELENDAAELEALCDAAVENTMDSVLPDDDADGTVPENPKERVDTAADEDGVIDVETDDNDDAVLEIEAPTDAEELVEAGGTVTLGVEDGIADCIELGLGATDGDDSAGEELADDAASLTDDEKTLDTPIDGWAVKDIENEGNVVGSREKLRSPGMEKLGVGIEKLTVGVVIEKLGSVGTTDGGASLSLGAAFAFDWSWEGGPTLVSAPTLPGVRFSEM